MTAGTIVYFIIFSIWTADGYHIKAASGDYTTESECNHYLRDALKTMRLGEVSKTGQCLASAPKPAGLPDVQPHVPAKIES